MEVNLKDTVIGKIAMYSLTNPKWDNLSVEDAQKRIEKLGNAENISNLITYDSEVAAIEGMATVLGLNEEQVTKLIGTRDEDGKLKRDGQIYTQSVMDSLANYMHEAGVSTNEKPFNSQERSIIKMLSVIHDKWVRSNPNKFMQEGRDKEYQFAPLMLLDWEEAKSDLIFLQPILEAGQVEIDEESLKKAFELEQMEFLLENGITSHDALVYRLSRGKEFYSPLYKLETKNGGNIEDLLADSEIAEKMAKQIEDKVKIKSEEELITDLIKSENQALDNMMWLTTKRQIPSRLKEIERPGALGKDMISVDSAISRREYILSRIIGKPYPRHAFVGDSIFRITSKDDPNKSTYDPAIGEYVVDEEYRNELIDGTEENGYLDKIYEERRRRGRTELKGDYDRSLDKLGIFGKNMQAAEKTGKIECHYSEIAITKKDLLLAGLDPDIMGWEEDRTITPEEIAEVDKQAGITTREVEDNKLKKLFKKLFINSRDAK